jgi:5'-nucleotidase
MTAGRRILVTNDDGYRSEGLKALADAMAPLAEVWVVAPSAEQSAVSHALTLSRPLRVEELGERWFAVDGTPTDCVMLALGSILRESPPDLVVSGINLGANMGVDVHYSGTVSAAIEAVILGVPAISVSQQLDGRPPTFDGAEAPSRQLARWVLEHGIPPGTLLNVNVPLGAAGPIELTSLGTRRYSEDVVSTHDPRGQPIFWVGNGEPIWDAVPGTDFHAVGHGRISVTPLQLDLTDHDGLERLRREPPHWVGFTDG